MTKQYLLEIGLEEIPARFLDGLIAQLVDNMKAFLTEHRLSFDTITPYSTPRRLAVIVDGLAEKQSDLSEKLRGPSLKIAKNDQGEWTPAAQGFTRGQGMTTDDIFVEEVNGEAYIFVEKFTKGKNAFDILTEIPEVIKAFNLPNAMTWHNYQTSFIRPLHWFVSLLDDEIVPFEYVHIESGRISQGHRFLGQAVEIQSPTDYVESLREQYVLVDQAERRETIVDQINTIAEENHWEVPLTEDLLEEVTNLVEWPTAFYGEFSEDYLKVPDDILITAMRDHQRYFYVLDKENQQLLPIFISVRNGNDYKIENVVKGNQKVIVARLEDALFFYEEDIAQSVIDFTKKLENVNEHYQIGTLADKQDRVGKVVRELIEHVVLGEEKDSLLDVTLEAARMYKFDLMTAIIQEFDELQGVMGEQYAVHFGVRPEVARAIGTQYLPLTSGGALPDTTAGALLAMADKLDTIISYFAIDIIPTGSNDPFALRRQAMGILEIMQDQGWHIDLNAFIQAIVADRNYEKNEQQLVEEVANFIKARMEPPLRSAGVDHDIIQAIEAAKSFDATYLMNAAVQLQAMKTVQPAIYTKMVEALTRVVNLGSKVDTVADIDNALLENESEQQLVAMISTLKITEDVQDQLIAFQNLVQPITLYFESTMVNDENEAIKSNRYQTMATLTQYILQMMDPRQLISKF